jgi:hypothetical protein
MTSDRVSFIQLHSLVSLKERGLGLRIPRPDRISTKTLSDPTIIQRPDCLFRFDAQSASRAMTTNVILSHRLSILRAGDRSRKWKSLDDQRVCSVCERKFKGRQIEIRRFHGRYKLFCPTLGCPSGPHQWLYPRTPVVSELTDSDWWHAGKQPTRCIVESTPQPHGQRV